LRHLSPDVQRRLTGDYDKERQICSSNHHASCESRHATPPPEVRSKKPSQKPLLVDSAVSPRELS